MFVRSFVVRRNNFALFGERRLLVQIIGGVQLRHVFRDDDALGVLPWTAADAVARVDGLRSLRTEIRMPCLVAGAGPGREGLAMLVGAFDPAEIGALAGSGAADKERHVRGLR